MIKFQPYKGCNCPWCRGSKQNASGSSNYRFWKKYWRRRFRRTGQRIGIDYEMPTFQSTDRMY